MKAKLVVLAPFTLVALFGLMADYPAVPHPPINQPAPVDDSLLSGELLAIRYCGGCHLFPEPALLDKRTWQEDVLPNMALRLGIRENKKDPYTDILPNERSILRAINAFPDEPLLAEKEWKKIIQYYIQEAPAQPLPQKSKPSITLPAQSLFDVTQLSFDQKPMPRISMLEYDTATHQLYVGDADHGLYILNNRFEFKSAWTTESPPVAMDFPENSAPRLLTIGSFSPSDLALGRFATFDTTAATAHVSMVNISSLPRAVHFACADLNMDGKEDLIICGFGNQTGKLSWYDDFQPSKERVLKALPGALKVEVGDFNADGKPDLMVLMGQAWEELSIFYNAGGGKFNEKKVLQFTPVFGASYFELADFNNDGHPDILLSNGDNWDFSRINKNYHGVRIYLNDGKFNFKEHWFFPLHGASKAITGDFDSDGDLDIAAISFYADKGELQNGFIYLINQGQMDFKPYSLPDAIYGKWLTMEMADFDKDGDLDIVLGSYLHNLSELSQVTGYGISTFPQLLVLTNQTDKRDVRSTAK